MTEDFIPQLELDDENIVLPQEVAEETSKEKEVKEEDGSDATDDYVVDDDTIIDVSSAADEDEPNEEEGEDDKPAETGEVPEKEAVSVTYQTLVNKGILSEEEDVPETWDALDEKISSIPNQVAQALVMNTPKIGQSLIDFVFKTGDRLTADNLREFYKEHLDVVEFTETGPPQTEEDAEKFVESMYSKQRLSATAIRAAIVTLKDENELLEEAERLYKLDEEARAAKVKERVDAEGVTTNKNKDDAKQYWQGVSSAITETKWEAKKQKSIYDFLAKRELNNRLNDIYKDPKALVFLADFVEKYDPSKKEFNLDAYKKQVASEEAGNIKKNILKDGFGNLVSKTGSTAANPNRTLKIENLEPIIE